MVQPNPFAQAAQAAPVNPFAQVAPAAPAAPAYPPAQQPAPQAPPTGGSLTPEQVAALFANPAKQETDRPRFLEIGFRNDGQAGGRLILISPKKLETVPNPKQPGQTQDRLTADVVILDGGYIEVGGQPEKGKPHTARKETPLLTKDMFVGQKAIVSQCREALGRRLAGGGLQLVIGRIGFGEAKNGNNAPYLLFDATDEEKQLAALWYSQNVDKLQ